MIKHFHNDLMVNATTYIVRAPTGFFHFDISGSLQYIGVHYFLALFHHHLYILMKKI